MFKAIARYSLFCKDKRGSSAVEFALVAPVLLLLMLGTIDFGRLLWMTTTVEHAATAGARYAGVRGSGNYGSLTPTELEAEITLMVKNRATGIAPSDLAVAITWLDAGGNPLPPPDNVAGGSVTVTATYNFQFILVGFLSLPPFDLTGTSRVMIA